MYINDDNHLREYFDYNQKKQICPKCNSTNTVFLSYGLPDCSAEEQELIDRGDIVLAGCGISEDTPNWGCRDCEHTWKAAYSPK